MTLDNKEHKKKITGLIWDVTGVVIEIVLAIIAYNVLHDRTKCICMILICIAFCIRTAIDAVKLAECGKSEKDDDPEVEEL
ncbi:MAG: hypothetical protein K2J80_10930 [Oscillospiraceae bacterium]|nr:hypothetical protein [Oscillospiraceae bacterium]